MVTLTTHWIAFLSVLKLVSLIGAFDVRGEHNYFLHIWWLYATNQIRTKFIFLFGCTEQNLCYSVGAACVSLCEVSFVIFLYFIPIFKFYLSQKQFSGESFSQHLVHRGEMPVDAMRQGPTLCLRHIGIWVSSFSWTAQTDNEPLCRFQ